MDQKKIGIFIATLRKEKDLTQEQLGEKLGVSKNAVSKWERGICLMDMSLLKPLSKILEVDVSEILNGERKNKNTDVEQILENTIIYQVDNNKKKELKFLIALVMISVVEIIILNFDTFFRTDSIESLFAIIIGIAITLLGIFNYKGNVKSIHWYNRKNVTKQNSKKYSKVMGIGTMIIGLGIVFPAILQTIYKLEEITYVTVGAIIVGLLVMVYAQFKYNKGIF